MLILYSYCHICIILQKMPPIRICRPPPNAHFPAFLNKVNPMPITIDSVCTDTLSIEEFIVYVNEMAVL